VTALAAGPAAAVVSPQIETFDVRGGGGTVPLSINAKGAATGYWGDNSGNPGLLRQSDGTIATFGAPVADPGFGTSLASGTRSNRGRSTELKALSWVVTLGCSASRRKVCAHAA